MAETNENVLRQSYDFTGQKIYPLVVVDGILLDESGLTDESKRGGDAIVTSISNKSVTFERIDASVLYIKKDGDSSVALGVNISEGSSNIASYVPVSLYNLLDMRGNVQATGSDGIQFGKYTDSNFSMYGKLYVAEDGTKSYGKIELYGDTSMYFSVGTGKMSYGYGNSPQFEVTTSSIKHTGSATFDGNTIIGGSSGNGYLYAKGDVSINKKLTVGGDASLNGKLKVGGELTFNGRLNANSDASIKSRLYVYHDTNTKILDASSTGVSVTKKTTLDSSLIVKGDASIQNRLQVYNGSTALFDASTSGIGVYKKLTATADASIKGRLQVFTSGGAAVIDSSTKVQISKDTSITENLQVSKTATIDSSAYAKYVHVIGTNTTNKTRYIGSDSATNMYVSIDGAYPLVVEKGVVRRGASASDVTLGSSSYPWKHTYTTGLTVGNGGASFNSSLIPTTPSSNNVGSSSSRWNYGYFSNIDDSGQLKVGGVSYLNNTAYSRNLYPYANNSYDIGADSSRYRSIYVNNMYVKNPWNALYNEGDVDPFTAGMDHVVGGNRGSFFNPDNVEIKKSVRGSESSYTFSNKNEQINEFVSKSTGGFTLSQKSESSEGSISDNMIVRFTVPEGGYPYMALKRILIYVTAYNWNLQVNVKTMKNGSTDYVDRGTYKLTGWSGWNSIPLICAFGGADTQTSNVRKIELYFSTPSINGSVKTVPKIRAIHLEGVELHSNGGYNMPSTGHIYDWDSKQNAIFPASIKATSPTDNKHHLVCATNQLNLAGNITGDTMYFNYRAGSTNTNIKMCNGNSAGGLAKLFVNELDTVQGAKIGGGLGVWGSLNAVHAWTSLDYSGWRSNSKMTAASGSDRFIMTMDASLITPSQFAYLDESASPDTAIAFPSALYPAWTVAFIIQKDSNGGYSGIVTGKTGSKYNFSGDLGKAGGGLILCLLGDTTFDVTATWIKKNGGASAGYKTVKCRTVSYYVSYS